ETSEQLVVRARYHADQARCKRSSEPSAAKAHDEQARTILRRLWTRCTRTAHRAGCQAFGSSHGLYEEVVQEAAAELSRIVLGSKSLRNLDRRFSASFESVCIDAVRSVRRNNRGRSGSSLTYEQDGEKRSISFVASDEAPIPQEDEGAEPLTLQHKDRGSLDGFAAIVGESAFDSIVHRLPPRQLKVLSLRLQGIEYKEIAALLKINRDTASSDFQKARAFIETNIAPQREDRP
ncbi:sigma-70 family RNA polymerase sigma factor, partial [bacterium]